MKIENLKEGMILKNYKELCSVLEINVATGKQKQLQFKELDRFCAYRKDGHKIIIEQLFQEVKVKMDKRINGNNTKYAEDLEYLILSLLNKFQIKEDEKVGFSKNFLYSHCGLTNDNYRLVKGNALKFSQLIDMPIQTINECFDYTNNRMLKTLQRTLNKMQRKSLITWGNGYNMVLVDEENKQHLEVASIEAEKHILSIERETMKQLGYDSKRWIFMSGQWENFKRTSTEKLKMYYPNLYYYYDSINFNYNNEDISKELEDYELIDKIKLKELVNDKFSKSLDGTIDRRHKKAREKTKEEIKSPIDNYKKSNNYTSEQKQIKNTIVDKSSEKISLYGDYDKTKVKSLQKNFFEQYSIDKGEQLKFNEMGIVELAEVPF